MAKGLTAAQIAQKQVDRLGESTEAITRGIQNVTESPTEKAAANLDKAATNYAKAISSGKTKKALLRVTLAEWQAKTTAKVGRVAEGARESQPIIQQFHEQRMAHQDKIDSKLKSMPKKTIQDSANRMLFQMKEMAGFEFEKRA